MRANEFVKKFGWERAKELVNGLKVGWYTNGIKIVPAIVLDNGETWINYDDLKRLVESHELVEHYKNTYGVNARWFFIANYCQEHRLAPHQSDVYDFVATKYDSYIADVESCCA